MSRTKKSMDVQKFGGVENLGDVKMHGFSHDASSVEVESKTKLEFDEGHGDAAIIRCFTFGMNPHMFRENPPTKQELFNSHLKGIELALWRDGMKVLPDVEPRLTYDMEALQYRIFVAAIPQRGHILRERPQTLSEIART